jgi:hypothetical protein
MLLPTVTTQYALQELQITEIYTQLVRREHKHERWKRKETWNKEFLFSNEHILV